MKTLVKVLVGLALLALFIPVVSYRTVRPCEMLRKELVRQAERKLEAARDSVNQAAAVLGPGAREAADAVASSVQHLTAGLVAGAAAAKVERMSAGECVSQLIRTRVKGDQGD